MFYVLLFTGTLGAGLAGFEIDIMTAVSIVFYVFPLGLIASMALLAAFNFYAWLTE